MKTLVTGATGLVGSALTRQLVAQGASVRILRRPTSKLDLLADATDHVEHAIGDVTDPESIAAAMQGIQHVYHTAAYLGFGDRGDVARRLHAVNVEGTAHVVNMALAAGVERLVHTSSIAALGRTPKDPRALDETATWRDSASNTAYAVTKYKAELEIHRGIAEGLDAVIVNPSLIFGIGREGENTRQIIDRVRRRKLPAAPAGGTNAVDVADVAAGHIRAMERGQTGERYLLVGENLSWRALIDTIAAAFEVEPPRFVMQPWMGMLFATIAQPLAALTRTRPLITRETVRATAHTYRYSNRKALEALGCHFRPFQETVERIATALR